MIFIFGVSFPVPQMAFITATPIFFHAKVFPTFIFDSWLALQITHILISKKVLGLTKSLLILSWFIIQLLVLITDTKRGWITYHRAFFSGWTEWWNASGSGLIYFVIDFHKILISLVNLNINGFIPLPSQAWWLIYITSVKLEIVIHIGLLPVSEVQPRRINLLIFLLRHYWTLKRVHVICGRFVVYIYFKACLIVSSGLNLWHHDKTLIWRFLKQIAWSAGVFVRAINNPILGKDVISEVSLLFKALLIR